MSKKLNSNSHSSNIAFTYNNFDKSEIHEQSFQEKNFEEILEKCFETSVKIDRIEVRFDKTKEVDIHSHTTNSFKCRIDIIPLGETVTSAGSDPAKTTREACHLAVNLVRETKNKLSSH